ncbi:hypothetical protein OS175_08850 [Marinicella sp. S1101]|nr:hypothetical protein [Marinicella marina]MCX7553984.1 hypothetical protein [Marinicella marina]
MNAEYNNSHPHRDDGLEAFRPFPSYRNLNHKNNWCRRISRWLHQTSK